MPQDSHKRTQRRNIVASVAMALVLVLCVSLALLNNGGIPSEPDGSLPVPSDAAALENEDSSDETPAEADAGDPSDTPELPDYVDNTVLAVLPDGVDTDAFQRSLDAIPELAGTTIADQTSLFVSLALPPTITVESALDTLQRNDLVVSAQPDYYYHTMEEGQEGGSSDLMATPLPDNLRSDEDDGELTTQAAPNDSNYSKQWGLPAINALAAWDYLATRPTTDPVVVAVLDNCFDVTHEDLAGNIVYPYDATALSNTADVSGHASHGTHVAGIVGAVTNNSRGVASITDNICKVMPVKVAAYKMTSTGGWEENITTSSVSKSVDYVISKRKEGVNVRVINMSLGGGREEREARTADLLMYQSIQNARDAGILTVVAACNSSKDFTPPYYASPSDFDNVISVINVARVTSASNTDGVARDYSSNYNVSDQRSKDISAPGTNIYSTMPTWDSGDKYAYMTGTSMASPLVAGVLGLMFSTDPDLTPDQATSKLFSTARDLTKSSGTSVGWDAQTGYGLVDAATAIDVSRPYIKGPTALATGAEAVFTVEADGVQRSGFTWSSSNTTIATIDATTGRLRCIGAGEVILTAIGPGGAKASQTVAIYGIDGPTVVKTGSSGTFSLSPMARGTWTWSLSDTTYASISSYSGLLTLKPVTSARTITVTVTATPVDVYPLTGMRPITKNVTLLLEPPVTTKAVYRLYNPQSGLHHYTSDSYEVSVITSRWGWKYEGVGWRTATTGSIPVYRVYHPETGHHHYTTDSHEVSVITSRWGWRYEGIAWYSAGTVKVYRLYSPYNGEHHYTTDAHEMQVISTYWGWKYEGIGWYSY